MPNKNLYIDSFKQPLYRNNTITQKNKLIKTISLSAALISGILIGTFAFNNISNWSQTKSQASVLGAVSTKSGYSERFSTIIQGGLTFTGNALQIANKNFAPSGSYEGNNTGGTFITLDQNSQDAPYARGSTPDWQNSSSAATLRIPTGAEILYAELIWGGNYVYKDIDLTSALDTPVTLQIPGGSPQTIAPDPATAGISYYEPDRGSNDHYYVRTQNVTDIVKQAGAGVYSVKGVPGIANRNNDNSNGSGWTLAVAYEDKNQPSRKLSIYTTLEPIEANTRGNLVTIQNFATPPQGQMGGRLLLSALEGDMLLTGDEFTFGDNQNNLQYISGPNNPRDNFFGSQINGDNGQIDRSGTLGNNNAVTGRVNGNERHGWDITNVDISQYLKPSQTSAYAQATSRGDGYLVTAMGVQINVNAPAPEITISRDKDVVRVGETITYTIEVKGGGAIDSNDTMLSSFVPEGTSLVPGSFKIDGQDANGDPTQGVSLGNLTPTTSRTITFTVDVDRLPPSNLFENEANLTYKYTPIAGMDPVQSEVNSDKVVTFGLRVVGQPPVAQNDSQRTKKNTQVLIDVLNNDSDPDGFLQTSTLKKKTDPTNGTVQYANGKALYTPNNNFVGQDTFEYEICDNDGNCTTAQVTVDIVDPQPPVANDDNSSTKQDTPVKIAIKNNDTDPLNSNIPGNAFSVTKNPTNGTVAIDPNTGEATYTPNQGYTGADSFEYKLCNADGCDLATVNVTVDPLIKPDAIDDSATTKENQPVTIPSLSNDTPGQGTDFDNDTLKVTTPPQNGTTSVNTNTGEIVYTPNPGFSGTDTFTYEICNELGECDTAVDTITVTPLTPPTANDDEGETDAGEPVTIPLLDNDEPGDGDLEPDTTTVVDQPQNGTVTIDPDTGEATYTPNPDFSGEDTFVYEVCDTNDKCDTANVVVNVKDKIKPDAINDSVSTERNQPVNIPILNNDKDDLDGIQPSDFKSIVRQPDHGDLTIDQATGQVTYTPDQDYVGADTFEYQICNLDGECDNALVSIDIKDPSKPDAIDDSANTTEDKPVTIPVLNNDTPGPGSTLDPSTLKPVDQPDNGTITVNPDGTVTYTPNPGYNGPDRFSYEICNEEDECDTANVVVNVDPLPRPDAIDDNGSTDQNKPVTIPVQDNDLGEIDPDSTEVIRQPDNGTTTVNPDGTVTYTPNPGFTGEDFFTYKICNSVGKCDSADVRVTVGSPAPSPSPSPTNNNPRPRGQVLGAYENTQTPRTGGLDQLAGDALLFLGFILGLGFFSSLYFNKSKESKKI